MLKRLVLYKVTLRYQSVEVSRYAINIKVLGKKDKQVVFVRIRSKGYHTLKLMLYRRVYFQFHRGFTDQVGVGKLNKVSKRIKQSQIMIIVCFANVVVDLTVKILEV